MQIEVEVKGQRIKRLNSPGSVEDTLNYLTCHFTFDGSEWENTIKTAYFKNRATEKIYSSLIADDGTCTVPWEALTDKGPIRFSVAGERENYRITTGIESFYNSETVYGGNPSEPPTPDQYDQMIALAQETKEIAESVREDADAGKFDGEPGKPGDPGKDGVSPSAKVEQTDEGAVITVTDATGTTKAKLKNGKDGNPGRDATDEQVRTAVEAYMEEHPIQGDTEDIIKLAIKNEASGAVPISITDSADMGVQDLEMQGWTEQAQYEGKNLFDKSEIVLSGTTITYMPVNVGDGEYTLSTNYIAPGRNDIFFLPGNVNTGASSLSNGVEHGTSRTVTSENGYVTVALRLSTDGTTSPLDYQIMLNSGSAALPYEPYTGGAPSPNPDYPQEIVSAGKYDEGTGKYQYTIKISDSEESPTKSQTVLLTSDHPLTKWDKLEKRDGVWGWVYKSGKKVIDGTETYFVSGYGYISEKSSNAYINNNDMVKGIPGLKNGHCNRLTHVNAVWATVDSIGFCYNNNQIHMRISNDSLGTTSESTSQEVISAMKNYMSQQYNDGNPFVFWYETAKETFVPLSESEQEAVNALHTYYPTTVLSNDAGCEMTIKYIADTKAYIDSKIAAIQAAVVNRI